MLDDNWHKLREIFDVALGHKPEERQNYIVKVCGGDKTLLAEVESLLASLDSSESFMETPAVAKVADAFVSDGNKLEKDHCLGHYKIIKQLGTGGMGEVYLAKDQKLDRQVAVKILNEKFSNEESNLIRFIREAKAASALNHPNILVIHEIGEADGAHYIISEYVEGETLRAIYREKALQLSEVLDVSFQIAGALTAAHKAHLIHRDIKPENIMIRPDGYVKILDFGLAKLIEQKNRSFLGLEESTAIQNQTAKGLILGTVNYMSPEQAKGEDVDERTDIFSLGVMIYEMIAGTTPFAGDSMSETFANLINAEPQPLSRFSPNVPDELQHIVAKMLRKNKGERNRTMDGLLADLKDLRENLTFDEKLERSGSPGAHATEVLRATTGDANLQTAETQHSFSLAIKRHKPLAATVLMTLLVGAIGIGYYFFYAGKSASGADGKKSIAVLPLKPINATNRDEIYEIGIADSLIIKLSSMKGFIIRPLSATRKYVDVGQDAVAAGKEQQVDYVLASNYQLASGKIRVTAQLFNVASGLIEETYKGEKDAANIFAMQDAIASEVGDKLLARFATTSSSPAAKRGTTNEKAYRLFLLGMNLYDKRNLSESEKAVEIFEQALKLDPNYAQAWAGLAHAHRSVANMGGGKSHEEYQKSIEAINKALALNENLADAHSALCENKMYSEWDFAGAERECQRAIELDSNSALSHQIYARYLNTFGRFDESIAEVKTAIDLDPASPFNQRSYGVSLYFARRYSEADAQLKQVIIMNPNFASAYIWLWNSSEMQGNYSEAFEWFMKAQEIRKRDVETVQNFKTIFQISGWQGVLRERIRLNEETDGSFVELACLNAQIGNNEKAFEYLEKAYQRREWGIVNLQVEPRYDSLRSDPRFDELAKRVGLK
ncbi:MAG: protein kinase [Pyrinomonadaceae bacterium]